MFATEYSLSTAEVRKISQVLNEVAVRGVIGARAEEEMDRRSALVFSVPAVMLLLFLLDVSNKASLGDGNGKAEIMRVLRKLQAPQVSLGSMFRRKNIYARWTTWSIWTWTPWARTRRWLGSTKRCRPLFREFATRSKGSGADGGQGIRQQAFD